MSELSGSKGNSKQLLKDMIRKLHAGAKVDEVKEQFKEVLAKIGPADIAQTEEELIQEGLPREEIRRLCEVHLALFKEPMAKAEALAPPGHPIHTLMEEHRILLRFADDIRESSQKVKQAKDFGSVHNETERLDHSAEHLKDSDSHYAREENVLFPHLEKHGVTQPPAVMWSEHNEIRGVEKNLYELLGMRGSMAFQDFSRELANLTGSLADMLESHFYKENKILFPTALEVIEANEWPGIRKEFDELGYCCFTPEYAREAIVREETGAPRSAPEGQISFETGDFSREELEALLNTLPVDITFVDREDRVRYFSQAKERIFPRTKAVIGRTVQQCHPQKSLHVVNQIVDDFKNGRRDVAEFWINVNERLIYIRYFPVRRNGEYLGTLEVTQDITEMKGIEGEKRLL